VMSRREWNAIGKKAGWSDVLVSDCCGAKDGPAGSVGGTYRSRGMCPKCYRSCEFIKPDKDKVPYFERAYDQDGKHKPQPKEWSELMEGEGGIGPWKRI